MHPEGPAAQAAQSKEAQACVLRACSSAIAKTKKAGCEGGPAELGQTGRALPSGSPPRSAQAQPAKLATPAPEAFPHRQPRGFVPSATALIKKRTDGIGGAAAACAAPVPGETRGSNSSPRAGARGSGSIVCWRIVTNAGVADLLAVALGTRSGNSHAGSWTILILAPVAITPASARGASKGRRRASAPTDFLPPQTSDLACSQPRYVLLQPHWRHYR